MRKVQNDNKDGVKYVAVGFACQQQGNLIPIYRKLNSNVKSVNGIKVCMKNLAAAYGFLMQHETELSTSTVSLFQYLTK